MQIAKNTYPVSGWSSLQGLALVHCKLMQHSARITNPDADLIIVGNQALVLVELQH